MYKIIVVFLISLFWLNCTIAQKTAVVLSEKDRYSFLRKSPDEMGIDTLREVMLYQINVLREEENKVIKKENAVLFKTNHKPLKPILKPLQLYEPLNKVAMKFIKYGNEHGNFDTDENDKHFSPDAHLSEGMKTPGGRVTEAGIRFNKHVVDGIIKGVSENLVGSNGDVITLMNALMHSPGHRKNLLSPFFCFVGIGYYNGSKAVVQVFIAELE